MEALIRLSQARAKACLREFVLKEDAEDVVELMRESVHQVHMDSNGILDKTRGGVIGKMNSDIVIHQNLGREEMDFFLLN